MENKIEDWKNIETDDYFMQRDLNRKEKELSKRFINKLDLSNGFLPTRLGAGLDRMNVHNISGIAFSYAFFLKETTNAKKNVVIAFDGSQSSQQFAIEAAKVLTKEGFKVFFFESEDLQTSPLVSYVINKNGFAGGFMVTGGRSKYNWSCVRVFNENGFQISGEWQKKINDVYCDIDILSVKKEDFTNNVIPSSLVSEYINGAKYKNKKNIGASLSFVGQSITTENMAKLFFDNHGVKSFMESNYRGNNRNAKTWSIQNERSLNSSISISKSNKTDIAMTMDEAGEKIAIAVRYKKRFKYFSGNKLAAIILEDILKEMAFSNKLMKKSYIVTTNISNGMTRKIAKKYGVRIIEVIPGFNNISAAILENGLEDFLMAYDHESSVMVNSNGLFVQDPYALSLRVNEIAGKCKANGETIYDFYKNLEIKYGSYVNSRFSKKLDGRSLKSTFKKLSRLKRIAGHKVENIINLDGGAISVEFKDGASITARVVNNPVGIEVFTQIIGDTHDDKLALFPFKREVEEWVNENSEQFEDKKFTKKGVIKYTFFSSISIGILVFIFLYFYKSISNNGNNASLSQIATWWADSSPTRWLWMTHWIWKVCTLFISAWMKKRMFMRLGENVSTKHLMISAVMGSVIAFVTPFAVGGDAIGYWYLRRKKVKRSILAATLASSTLWGETKFALQTILLVWIGWPTYQTIFASGDPQAHAALIWFFIGLSWTIFSSFMIFILTASRRFQEFIVRYSVIVLEWFPLIHIHDLEDKESAVQYEFYLIRTSMRKIWNKWWFILEMMFYDLIPLFFSPIVILRMYCGLINPDAPSGMYWTPIVIGDITGTANSMSITPGGSGTAEWLNMATKGPIFNGTPLTINHNLTTQQITAGSDLFYKVFFGWPMLAVSTFTIFIVMLSNRKSQTTKVSNKALGIILSSILAIALTIYLLLIIYRIIL